MDNALTAGAGAPAPPASAGAQAALAALLFGREELVPATTAQRELAATCLADPQVSAACIHPISVFLQGPLDRDALYSALLALIGRHAALRSRYPDGGATVAVRERIGFELPVLELSAATPQGRELQLANFIAEEIARPFDLREGPLFRATLVQRAADDAVLVFSCHHAAVDGWSLNVILDELPKLYTAMVRRAPRAELPAVAPLADYLHGAVARERAASAEALQFWRSVYPDGAPVLELPLDRARPRRRALASQRIDHRVSAGIAQGMKRAAARAGCSPFVGLLAAYAIFLARISAQEDVVVAVPSAGQLGTQARLLGHDSRLLPIRCTLREGDSFVELAGRVADHFVGAFEHQWVTLEELVDALAVPVDASRAPLASAMFSFDPGMETQSFHFEGLSARHYFNPRAADRFEISINAVVEGEELLLECTYATALFDAAQVAARLVAFEHLLAALSWDPTAPVARHPLLPPAQAAALDAALNSTDMDYERSLTVDALVERVVRAQPDRTAVASPGLQLTYRQLWEDAGRVCRAIQEAGLGPKPMVGVMLERSAAMLPVLLGAWRAGASFVPLDPAFPADRLQYMVTHSGIRLLLTQGAADSAARLQGVRRLDIATLAGLAPEPAAVPARGPDDIAYVLYTSGSTGQPKGVQVAHRALNNFLHTMATQAPTITPADRVLGVTTLSFDIAQLELWLPAVVGATSFVVDRATAMDGRALAATIRDQGITFVQATPSTWRLLLVADWEGDPRLTALVGGEALTRDLADALLPRVGRLWNVYGPTETTVWSTIDRVDAGPITIGRPIGNTQAYVLDANRNWVPQGSIGELWLGGDGVAAGYLGRDDLTNERFVRNPFTGQGRMYRTGDLVRLRPDGRIEYIGRNDFQVKIRGYRIELAEVQLALARIPSIAQCVVTGKARGGGDAVLVAYYTPRAGANPSAAELKSALAAALPDYMVPGIFVPVAVMPLTHNGKIDIKALPEPFAPL